MGTGEFYIRPVPNGCAIIMDNGADCTQAWLNDDIPRRNSTQTLLANKLALGNHLSTVGHRPPYRYMTYMGSTKLRYPFVDSLRDRVQHRAMTCPVAAVQRLLTSTPCPRYLFHPNLFLGKTVSHVLVADKPDFLPTATKCPRRYLQALN